MKKSSILSQLALAGIAAGLVSVAPLHAADAAEKSVKTDKHGCGGKSGCGGKDSVKGDKGSCKGHTSCKGKGGCKGVDSVKAGKLADTATVTVASHGCKGQNSCKGQGGCAMTEKDLKAAAKKSGTPMSKAGKAHSCKGQNSCKGLGGCGSM